MNRKIRNGLIIAGFGTFGILGVTILVANVRKADDGLRVYAAQNTTDVDEATVNGICNSCSNAAGGSG